MNIPTALGRGLLLAATSMGATGAMADIRLYEHASFGGAHVTLRNSAADMSGTGFNDKTSSIVVTSGRWEVCTNSNFRGTCTVLTRGEYPSLQSNLNDRISSVRETSGSGNGRGSEYRGDNRGEYRGDSRGEYRGDSRGEYRGDSRGEYRGDSRGEYRGDNRGDTSRSRDGWMGEGGPSGQQSRLELYSETGFGGQRVRIERDTSDLSRANFNDRASSAVVSGGSWEICADARYGGSCGVYPPGEYERLGSLNGQVSSVRRAR